MRPAQLLSIALLSSTISAWSLQDSFVDNKAVQGIENLFRRQDSSDDSDANAPTSTFASAESSATGSSASGRSSAESTGDSTRSSDSTSTDSSDSETSDASSGTSTGSATRRTSGSSGSARTTSGTNTHGSSGTASITSSGDSTRSYNASVGYGGLTMITPNPISSSSYYKVGNFLTFAWNFTSLSITPTAIDILATCTANQATYTLALNQSVSASTGAVTWDTGEYQSTATLQLLTETYTLIIHDAARDVSATPPYGGLAAYSQFRFAMYTKQAYTGLGDGWQCVTCSGAMSITEKQTLSFIFGMAAVTVLSFTWFAGSFGVF